MIQTNRTEILKCTDLASLITCFKGMVKDTYVVKCHDFMKVSNNINYCIYVEIILNKN